MELTFPLHSSRKLPPAKEASAYWSLLRAHGKSRKSAVEFICSIGGYSDRSDRFAIEFNISAWRATLDYDRLLERFRKGDGERTVPQNPAHAAIEERCFKDAYDAAGTSLWSVACEDAYRNWAESDTPYETFAAIRVNWEWGISGRGGKHLCLTECEGINLKQSPEDLMLELMQREEGAVFMGAGQEPWVIPNAKIAKLLILCIQLTVELAPDRIAEEVEYQALWRLADTAVNDAEALIEGYDERESLKEPASDIMDALRSLSTDKIVAYEHDLPERFREICKLAGVTV